MNPPIDQLKEDLSNTNYSLKDKDSQNCGGIEELKSFILKESPPPRNNVNLLSSQNLSEREISSSPIV